MLAKLIKKLPGIRGLVAQRDILQRELLKWKQNQSSPPGHYYSPIPDVNETKSYFNQLSSINNQKFLGIDFNWDAQISLFNELAFFNKELPFSSSQSSATTNRYYFENGFFSYADGILLYALLRYLKPCKIIEVGSGFSSCLILDTNEYFLDGNLDCTFIDPNPESLLENLRDSDKLQTTILKQKVQTINYSLFDQLQSNDILLIDSSHVSKIGSDVNFLLFEILPRLNPGVWIHFHDVFYPFEYPEEWILGGYSWNESYLVRAFLQYNNEFKIRLWGNALAILYPELVESLMPLCLKNTGASLWIQKQIP